jgi:hypothetical protein
MKTRLFRPGEITEREAGQADNGLNINREKEQSVRLLDIDEISAGLHEKAEAIIRPVYRISWHRRPVRLFGRWPLPGTDKGSGNFVKVSPDRIKMPPEALRRYELAVNGNQTEEAAAFIDTKFQNSNIGVILAVEKAGHWLELDRWRGSWRELGLSRLDICDA